MKICNFTKLPGARVNTTAPAPGQTANGTPRNVWILPASRGVSVLFRRRSAAPASRLGLVHRAAQLGPAAAAGLLQNVVHVHLHRARADVKLPGDPGPVLAPQHQGQHLLLPAGQALFPPIPLQLFLRALRIAAGSASAADIILPTMLATAFSTILGVLLVKLFIKTDDKRAKKNAAPKEREKRKFGPVRAKSKGQG